MIERQLMSKILNKCGRFQAGIIPDAPLFSIEMVMNLSEI